MDLSPIGLIAILVGAAALPALIGYTRRHPNQGEVALLLVVTGITAVAMGRDGLWIGAAGWLAAMVWACWPFKPRKVRVVEMPKAAEPEIGASRKIHN